MFRHLQIYDPRERVLVGLADAGLTVAAGVAHLVPARRATAPPQRILLLRLERIGDLLMSAPAIAAVRQFAPDATIDLVVGSWNASIARLIPGVDRVETLDAAWLARDSVSPRGGSPSGGVLSGVPSGGGQGDSVRGRGHHGRVRIRRGDVRGGGVGLRAMLARAWSWRARGYDLAINFEGDIRSHLLLALSGAPVRAGFTMAGGGPLLTHQFEFDPRQHTTANAWRLVRGAFGGEVPAGSNAQAAAPHPSPTGPGDSGRARDHDTPFRLAVPALARERAAALLGREPRVVALHASGGRDIKQWPVARLADAAARIARAYEATLVLTGSPGDRAIVDEVRAALPADVAVIDLSGEIDLPVLAAVLERCALFITGDTGPMHLAAAVGTPTVAVFGPSDPARYAPLSTRHRVVRIDLPCAPCNRIRLPPTRCQGHTPDCLEGIAPDAVVQAALDLRREVEGAARAVPNAAPSAASSTAASAGPGAGPSAAPGADPDPGGNDARGGR